MATLSLPQQISSSLTKDKLTKIALAFVSILIVVILLFLNRLSVRDNFFPRKVSVSNITGASLSISWMTDRQVEASLVINGLGDIADQVEGPSLLHHVTVGNLSPNTSYVYRIKNKGKTYTQNADGNAFPPAKTLPVLTQITQPHPIFGQVKMSDEKTPVHPAIVYLRVDDPDPAPGSGLLSTFVRANGFWLLDLGNLRDVQGRVFEFDENDLELIRVEADGLGSGEYQIKVGQDQPTIPLVVQ